jgi:hypothetical protein
LKVAEEDRIKSANVGTDFQHTFDEQQKSKAQDEHAQQRKIHIFAECSGEMRVVGIVEGREALAELSQVQPAFLNAL